MTQKTGFDIMVEEIMKYIEKHQDTPWRLPWSIQGNPPVNLVTRKPYGKLNALRLIMAGFNNQLWATKAQIVRQGGTIKDGEQATQITIKLKRDSQRVQQEIAWGTFPPPDGASTRNSGFTPTVSVGSFDIIPVYLYNVVGQTKGIELDILDRIDGGPLVPNEAAMNLMADYADPPEIKYGRVHASYIPSTDTVYMPDQAQFHHIDVFWSTLFHEAIGHGVWHPKRLQKAYPNMRLVSKEAESKQYAFMELVAELTAWFAAGYCGLTVRESRSKDSATYIHTYLTLLQGANGTKVLQDAINYAQKGLVYVIGEQKAKAAGLI